MFLGHILQMSILKIAKIGHPVLHEVALPVIDLADPKLSTLIGDMIETLEDSGGIGLAAPQVYDSKRVVIFYIPKERSLEDGVDLTSELTIMINPEIEPLSEETNVDWEACLSVPNFMGSVERYSHIKYSWMGLDGKLLEREATGYHARAVQHECDHLNGKLYPMRMNNFKTFGFGEEVNKNLSLLDEGRFNDRRL